MEGIKSFEKVRSGEIREDEAGVREFVDQYTIILKRGVQDHARVVKLARPDLLRWQPHEFDKTVRVRNWFLERRRQTDICDLEVEYSNTVPAPTDPLDTATQIEITTSDIVVPISRDADGQPLVNTAGQPFEGLTETFSLVTFNLTKNIPALPDWLLRHYLQAMNSDSVQIGNQNCTAETLKIASLRIGTEETYEEDTTYRQLRMSLVHHPDTWRQFVLNRGLQEVKLIRKPLPGGKFRLVQSVVPILDDKGEPIKEPQFLDADGRVPRVDKNATPRTQGRLVTLEQELRAMERGAPLDTTIKTPLDPEDIIVLDFKTRRSLPFNILPLN